MKPLFLLLLCSLSPLVTLFGQTYSWQSIAGAPSSGGKQDDIFFLNPDTGYCVNGLGRIFRTINKGQNFNQLVEKTGTYFRCIQPVNTQKIFAGNIGTNYFPNVSDTTCLYRSQDGGQTWQHVPYSGPRVKGLCAMSMVQTPIINAGILDTQTTIVAGGRVGGPAFLLRSDDEGQTWNATSMNAHIGMITDVIFKSRDTGFVFGGTSGNIAASQCQIIYTTDGGQNWTPVFQSSRSYETIWKAHFPSRLVGYATVLSYATNDQNRYVLKTTDGGLTWNEWQVSTNGAQLFGVGFINDSLGWVGSNGNGFKTTNGGLNWSSGGLTQACNKIRFVRRGNELAGYGIGVGISRLRITNPTATEPLLKPDHQLQVFPNPLSQEIMTIRFPALFGQVETVEVFDIMGKRCPCNVKNGVDFIEFSGFQLVPGQYRAKIQFSAAGLQTIPFQVQGANP